MTGGNKMSSINDLIQKIEKLSPYDRARIVDTVIRDITPPDPEIDKIWAEEASLRWNKYLKGETAPVAYKEVMSKYKRL